MLIIDPHAYNRHALAIIILSQPLVGKPRPHLPFDMRSKNSALEETASLFRPLQGSAAFPLFGASMLSEGVPGKEEAICAWKASVCLL